MEIIFTERKENFPIIEGSIHTWIYCSQCGWAVKCGNCGNGCCNGGSPDECLDRCDEAYALQDIFFNKVKGNDPAPVYSKKESLTPEEMLLNEIFGIDEGHK